MDPNLWANSIRLRLAAARALTSEQHAELNKRLCEGCPVPVWPLGNATGVNPLLITVGASPGNSPTKEHIHRIAQELPTTGVRHPGTHYEDSKRYWDKVRYLAATLIDTTVTSDEEAYALFANMNLNSAMSGSASNVRAEPEFVAWLMTNIRERFRPRVLVLLGLRTYLRCHPEITDVLESCFDGLKLAAPHRERRFQADMSKRYMFREWDIAIGGGNEMKLVMWPQHPSRVPFGSFGLWQTSCRESKSHHNALIHP